MKLNPLRPALLRGLSILTVVLTVAGSARAGGKYRVLHSFTCGTDSCSSTASLTFDVKGNLFGAAGGGGIGCDGYGCGVIFELKPRGNGKWAETILYRFAGGGDGTAPNGGVIFDNAGNLYGTTAAGGSGADSAGTVFELSPSAGGKWTKTTLYSFCSHSDCSDGGDPLAGVVLDKAGNLYGTTWGGDMYGGGVVFELKPGASGWTESVVYGFGGNTNGTKPVAGLVLDATGNLYGTTEFGGSTDWCASGCGVAFKISPTSSGGWKDHVLHRFGAFHNDGQNIQAGLVLDPSGSLYGAAQYGGTHQHGMVFELTPNSHSGWKETVLYNFVSLPQGSYPGSTLARDQARNLYGTAGGGTGRCSGGCGVVYKLTPASDGKWTYKVLHNFTGGQDGQTPYAGIILDKKGNVYGTTVRGGPNNAGVVYQITP